MVKSIFRKTENIAFLIRRKRHVVSLGYWQYNVQFLLAFYIGQELCPEVLGIVLMRCVMD